MTTARTALLWGAFSLAFVSLLAASDAAARPTFFSSRCASCHTDDTPTCNACHEHRGPLSVHADLAEYGPGAPVTITLDGGWESGWIRGLLYDQSGTEVDRASGPTGTGDDGQGSPVTFPVTLSAPAPLEPGSHVWQAAWYGAPTNTGGNHGEVRVPVTIVVTLDPTGIGDDVPDIAVEDASWGRLKEHYR